MTSPDQRDAREGSGGVSLRILRSKRATPVRLPLTMRRFQALVVTIRWWALCVLVLWPMRRAAAEPSAQGPVQAAIGAESIEVTVQDVRRAPGDHVLPLSRTIVDPELVARPAGLTATESLVTVPGILVQNRENQAQDVRLDIRGFGTRAAFGMRGVRLVLDGIPVTLPDGQTALDSAALSNLGRVEVIRGPASVLHGSTPGGVILLSTEEAPDDPAFGLRWRAGSFDSVELRSQAAGSRHLASGARLRYRVGTTSFASNGYRDHSSSQTEALHLRLTWVSAQRTRIQLMTDLTHAPRLQDPGGLTRQEFRADPRQAAPSSLAFDVHDNVRQIRSGIVLMGSASRSVFITSAIYLNARWYDGSRPERSISLDRSHLGSYLRVTSTQPWLGLPSRLSVGLELEQQSDQRKNFTNPSGRRSAPLLLDQVEQVRSMAVSAYEMLTPWRPLTLLAGVRYQRDRYALKDRLLLDRDHSGIAHFTSISALAGAAWDWTQGVWFVNAGRSHENPTMTELTNRAGGSAGLNHALGPIRATSYETGVRWQPTPKLRPELTLFRIDLQDELVAYTDETQRVYFRNSGRSHRKGIEATLGITLGTLLVRSSYTYLDARFDEYSRDGLDLSGRRVPGIPPHRWANAVRYGQAEGVLIGADLVWYDATYVNDANDEQSPAQLSTAVVGGYRLRTGPWQLTFEARLQNLLNRRQPDNLRINASGGRYYESAPGFGAFGGIQISYWHQTRGTIGD